MFLPGESQGRRSLMGCRLWGHTESDTTEVTQRKKEEKQTQRKDLWTWGEGGEGEMYGNSNMET